MTIHHDRAPHVTPLGDASDWGRLLVATTARSLIMIVLGMAFFAAAPAALGWHPTTAMTGSMEPRLSPGDVIVSRPIAADALVVGQVLLADDPDKLGALRLHRYVEPGRQGQIITKGDANADNDSTPVARSAVRGVAVIEVPYVGLPILWMRGGQWLNLSLLGLGLVAIVLLAGIDRDLRRRIVPAAPERTHRSTVRATRSSRVTGRHVVPTSRPRQLVLRVTTLAVLCVGALGHPAPAQAAPFGALSSNPTLSWHAATMFDCLGRDVSYSPTFSYQFGAASGTSEADSSTNHRTATLSSGVRRVAGTCGSSPYVSLDGRSGQVSATSAARSTSPTTFSLEAWIRTSAAGGDIISFGDAQSTTSSITDRSLYVGADGRLTFAVYTGERVGLVSRGSIADSAWHHVVATHSSAGMRLYVDGSLVAMTSLVSSQTFAGWWRIGNDSLAFQPNAPTNEAFDGDLDDVSVYPTALSATQVSALHAAGR